MAKLTGGGISFWSHVFTFPLLLLAVGVILYLFKKQGKKVDTSLPISLPFVTGKKAKKEEENPWVDFYLGEEVDFDFKRMMKKEI